MDKKEKVILLSIDGGGIRGVIPALILAHIESKLNKPIAKLFDLMAGTSTGGILVGALSLLDRDKNPRYKASDLVDFYKKEGPFIFSSNFFSRALSWVYKSLYSSEKLEEKLHKYFGEVVLKDSLTKLLMPSYDLLNDQAFFFKSYNEKHNEFIKLKDAIRATSAAPTYFSPKCIKIKSRETSDEVVEKERVLIDGGVFANNPAFCAYVNAKILFQNPKHLHVLSLGTGNLFNPLGCQKASRIGIIGWARPIVGAMLASGLDVVDYQFKWTSGNHLYIRINPCRLIGSTKIDDASEKNIEALEKEAIECIKNNEKKLDEICEMLIS